MKNLRDTKNEDKNWKTQKLSGAENTIANAQSIKVTETSTCAAADGLSLKEEQRWRIKGPARTSDGFRRGSLSETAALLVLRGAANS